VYLIGPFFLTFATLTSPEAISLNLIIFFLYFSFPANFLVYGVNDLYDKDTDSFNEKKLNYETSMSNSSTKDKTIENIIFATNILFIIYGLIFLSSLSIFFLLLFVLFAHQYSAPPLRAKAIPFLDSIVSGILYILPFFVSWGIVYNHLPPLWPTLAAIIWSVAMHAYSAVPDINADTQAGIKTGATILGKNNMLFLCGTLFVVASIISIPYLGLFSYLIGLTYATLIVLSVIENTPEATMKYYKMFPLVNTLIGGIIFILALYQNLFT